jgi:outer membrane protein W
MEGGPFRIAAVAAHKERPMRRVLMFAVLALVAVPMTASAQQSLNLSLGGFSPRAEDARDVNDVLVNDRSFLDFRVADLNGFTIGGEYLVAVGDKFDAGLGIGFYQRSTPAFDRFSEFQNTGDPIVADLKLRVVPMTATFRFLPLGHHDGVQPYIGAGAGVFAYRYSESGDFVASDNVTIIHGNFSGSGTATGPVVLGGVRIPIGSVGVGGEIRYQSAVGNLPANQGFPTATPGATPKIDLGGWTYSFTLNFRF